MIGTSTAPIRDSAAAMRGKSVQLGSCTTTRSPRRTPWRFSPTATLSALSRKSAYVNDVVLSKTNVCSPRRAAWSAISVLKLAGCQYPAT